jgi:hypothetical protein
MCTHLTYHDYQLQLVTLFTFAFYDCHEVTLFRYEGNLPGTTSADTGTTTTSTASITTITTTAAGTTTITITTTTSTGSTTNAAGTTTTADGASCTGIALISQSPYVGRSSTVPSSPSPSPSLSTVVLVLVLLLVVVVLLLLPVVMLLLLVLLPTTTITTTDGAGFICTVPTSRLLYHCPLLVLVVVLPLRPIEYPIIGRACISASRL